MEDNIANEIYDFHGFDHINQFYEISGNPKYLFPVQVFF
jgi:hypothetical protein